MKKQKKVFIAGVNGLLGQSVVTMFNRETDFEVIRHIRGGSVHRIETAKLSFFRAPNFSAK